MRRLNGKLLRRTLGQYPIMTLAEARDAALEALRDIERGIDPKEKKAVQRRAEALRRANSFASVAEEFILRHTRKLRSADDAEATIRRELISRWSEQPITDISRRDVVELVEAIADKGHHAAARKVYGHLSKLFNWAVARGTYGLEFSPCASVKLSTLIGAPEARQRILNEDEIRALWKATKSLGYPAAPFIKMLLLTGQRRNEVAQMSWAEVDLEQGLWVIPPSRMKSGAAHEVPLAPAAVELLKSLPRWTGPLVFSTTGGEKPISGFSDLKSRIDAALGDKVAPWRFHDLRRSMRTGLGGLPIPANVCEMCIGHQQPGLHRVYDRHRYVDENITLASPFDAGGCSQNGLRQNSLCCRAQGGRGPRMAGALRANPRLAEGSLRRRAAAIGRSYRHVGLWSRHVARRAF
jgi:integrase